LDMLYLPIYHVAIVNLRYFDPKLSETEHTRKFINI
jgi:hypothetical protein